MMAWDISHIYLNQLKKHKSDGDTHLAAVTTGMHQHV